MSCPVDEHESEPERIPCRRCDETATGGCVLCKCYYCPRHGGQSIFLFPRGQLCTFCYDTVSIGVIYALMLAVVVFVLVYIVMVERW